MFCLPHFWAKIHGVMRAHANLCELIVSSLRSHASFWEHLLCSFVDPRAPKECIRFITVWRSKVLWYISYNGAKPYRKIVNIHFSFLIEIEFWPNVSSTAFKQAELKKPAAFVLRLDSIQHFFSVSKLRKHVRIALNWDFFALLLLDARFIQPANSEGVLLQTMPS